MKREKPPPLARFQSRFLSRSLSFLSRFSTHDPTHRRLLTPFSTSSQPDRFANGAGRISPNCEAIARRGTAERSETAEGRYAGRGGVRRRGLSTSHQTGFNSLAAARPVVASASFLSSRRARPPRQLAKGRRGCPRRPLLRLSVFRLSRSGAFTRRLPYSRWPSFARPTEQSA